MQVSVTGDEHTCLWSLMQEACNWQTLLMILCVFRSLQDVQIWFQPNLGSSSAVFLPHSDSQDGFGMSQSQHLNIKWGQTNPNPWK